MQEFIPSQIHQRRAEREAAERRAKIVTLETARAAFVGMRDALARKLAKVRGVEMKTFVDHSRMADLEDAIALLDEDGISADTGLIDDLVEFFESDEVVAVRKLLRSPSVTNIESEITRLQDEGREAANTSFF